MKFGFRIPNINKRIAARTSWKRVVRHNLGFKAPRGMGWITNPQKAAYNRVYQRTSRGCLILLVPILAGLLWLVSCSGGEESSSHRRRGKSTYVSGSIDRRGRYRSGHYRNSVSLKKDAVKNQSRSKYYYHTHKKRD